jgi:hypothetical protein
MAEGGAPIRRAQVLLALIGGQRNAIEVPLVATDDQGYYEFRSLPAGRYNLTASKTGYMTLAYGQRRTLEAGRPVELANTQSIQNVDFALPRGGTIVATITNEFGDPVSGLTVQAQQYRFSGGQRRLTTVASGSGGMGFGINTNDLGEQRLFGLPPGEYYLQVTGRLGGVIGPADRGRAYAPSYYPGTASVSEAQRVTVAVGQEVRVTFPIVPLRAVRVSGTVRTSEGKALPQPNISLATRPTGGFVASGGISSQPDGSFVMDPVFPGDYVMTVMPNFANPSLAEFVNVPLSIGDRDVSGLSIVTSKGATVRGRFVFDTGSPPPGLRPDGLQVSMVFSPPGSGVSGRLVSMPDWKFEIPGVNGTGGQLRVGVNSAPGWFVKGVTLDGRDVTDVEMDFAAGRDVNDVQVLLTQKRTALTGGAQDAQNGAASDYVAILFPQNRGLWKGQSRWIAVGRPDQIGQFRIEGLPPGNYLAAAVEYLETGSEFDPELLTRLADGAQTVTLAEGEGRNVSLKIVKY